MWVLTAGGALRFASSDERNAGPGGCSGRGGYEPGAAGIGDHRWANADLWLEDEYEDL